MFKSIARLSLRWASSLVGIACGAGQEAHITNSFKYDLALATNNLEVMKIPVMTLTIALSTFSACLVSSEVQHGTKLGMRRHIINSKRPATTLSSTEKAFQDNKQASHAEEPGLPASNASSHQHEKRAYYGQGTYFDPGEGRSLLVAECVSLEANVLYAVQVHVAGMHPQVII